jgi:dipeptidyl aminopeptidase/acylaminoacyl peptidase
MHIIPRLFAFALIALLPIATFAQAVAASSVAAVPLTPERAVKYRRPSDLHFSADGSRVVCVVSEVNGPSTDSHLWLMELAPGTLRQITFSQKSERSPRWQPGSGALAFLSNRTGKTQVYLTTLDGAEPRAVTSSATDISDFRWSPDGKQIAYLAREPDPDRRDDDPKIADREQDLERLWVIDLASGQQRQVTHGAWRIDEFDWLSSDRLLAVASNHPKNEEWNDALYSLALDGTATRVAGPNQPFHGLLVFPGGTRFAYAGTRDHGPTAHDLFVQAAGGAAARDVTASIDRAVLDARWQNDGTLFVRVADGFRNRIYGIDLQGRAAPIDLPYSARGFDVAGDGTLVFVAVGFNRLPELYVRRADGSVAQIGKLQQGWDAVQLADAEIFRFKSFDGTQIEAALMKPLAASPTRKLPLVLLVHGGPASNFSADYFWFNAWPQLLAAAGYEVLMVNPRGSIGYGEKFEKANRGDLGGGDFKDLMAALDTVIARGETDPNRLGIGGWSYGAEMTQWAIGHTQRFRAAVSGQGVFDQTAEFGTESGPADDEWAFGLPWEHPEVFARNSPATFIRYARTPTLIVHGEDDRTNPVGQSMALYRALKHYGVESELLIYPGEGHLPHQERHQVDILRRMLDWYDRHLQ